MPKFTVEQKAEFEEILQESKSLNIKYRYTLLCADGSERRAFSRKVGDTLVEVDYVYSCPDSLDDAIEELGEDVVYKMFAQTYSTWSDDQQFRPVGTGRVTKKQIEAKTLAQMIPLLGKAEIERLAEKMGVLTELRALKTR